MRLNRKKRETVEGRQWDVKKIVKEKQLLAAIAGSRGVISTIAERLKMNWHTVRNAIDESEAAREAPAFARKSAQ